MYCNDWTSVCVFNKLYTCTCTMYDEYMMYWCIYMYIHVYVHCVHVHCIMCVYNNSTLCLYVNIEMSNFQVKESVVDVTFYSDNCFVNVHTCTCVMHT